MLSRPGRMLSRNDKPPDIWDTHGISGNVFVNPAASSVDDLKSSSSIRGIQMPNFELLDARIASALNRIIHNSHFIQKESVWRNKRPRSRTVFFWGRHIAYLIYEYFWVTGANDSVENYADLFTVVLRKDDIQEFDSKWDGIPLSVTKIPSDDILEGLYKLRIRGSGKLMTVLELFNMEIHQKKLGHDYHRLKTMEKRSIEQDIYEIRILAPGMEIMKETQWSRISWQNSVYKEFLEIVGNGKPTGSVLKETIAVSVTISISVQKFTQPNLSPSSFMQQNETNASVVECLDGPARITSKELAPFHFVKSDILQNDCSTSPRLIAVLE